MLWLNLSIKKSKIRTKCYESQSWNNKGFPTRMGFYHSMCPSRVELAKICNDVKSNPHFGWVGRGGHPLNGLTHKQFSWLHTTPRDFFLKLVASFRDKQNFYCAVSVLDRASKKLAKISLIWAIQIEEWWRPFLKNGGWIAPYSHSHVKYQN